MGAVRTPERNDHMKFAIVMDKPVPYIPLGTYLTVRCAWCGRQKLPINDGNKSPMNMSICRECANRLLHAKDLYHA